MRISCLATAAAFLLPAAASAQSMNAETFHQRATALQSKGPFALFSSDMKLLVGEAQAAGKQSRQLQLAAIKAGQKPRFCPPPEKPTIGSREFMTRLSAIPAAERARIDMTEAMTRILGAKFPCPKA